MFTLAQVFILMGLGVLIGAIFGFILGLWTVASKMDQS